MSRNPETICKIVGAVVGCVVGPFVGIMYVWANPGRTIAGLIWTIGSPILGYLAGATIGGLWDLVNYIGDLRMPPPDVPEAGTLAILEAIRDQPDSEVHWLALAGWLRDNGRDDEASTVRDSWPMFRDALSRRMSIQTVGSGFRLC